MTLKIAVFAPMPRARVSTGHAREERHPREATQQLAKAHRDRYGWREPGFSGWELFWLFGRQPLVSNATGEGEKGRSAASRGRQLAGRRPAAQEADCGTWRPVISRAPFESAVLAADSAYARDPRLRSTTTPPLLSFSCCILKGARTAKTPASTREHPASERESGVVLLIQVEGIDQHRPQAARARAHHVHVIEVPDVHRRAGGRAGAIEGNLEESRIRLFHPVDEGITDAVEIPRQPEAVERPVQHAVGVRHHHQLQSERREPLQRGHDSAGTNSQRLCSAW